MKILVTGSAGFVAGYLVEELLTHGHMVLGVDNFSRYGKTKKSYDPHPNYKFTEGDAKDTALLKNLTEDCDQVIALAGMIGGISHFRNYAYDLLAENDRLTASTFDAAIWAFQNRHLKKINVISSAMVYEMTERFPTEEGEELRCPPPLSTYGFQKLACEYFARGAWEQYRLPFTIIRLSNCVGIGEHRALFDKEVSSGNIRLAMSHVVPDLAQKVLKGQESLHILGSGNQIRQYTYGGDLARGIRLCAEDERARNEDFNLSTPVSTTVLELARMVWEKVRPGEPFRYISDPPYPFDVQNRIPSVEKAKRVLGFEANTPLDKVLDEVIPWVRTQIELGAI
jgi:UDP-glucose 4-epimerase